LPQSVITKLGEGLSRLMLRTSATPLRQAWSLAYASVARFAVTMVLRENPDASIYLKGSFASGEPVYGISDIDLVAVIPHKGKPGSEQLRAREKWKALCKRFPLLEAVIQHCWFYEDDDLRESSSTTCLTYGLASNPDEGSDRAGFLGKSALHDHMGLQTNPSLYGLEKDWRFTAGRQSRLATKVLDEQDRMVAAWLHLQYWWRHACIACAEPHRPHIPLLCVKLIAEPVRLRSWIERGEYLATREEALRRGLSETSEENNAIRLALHLMKELPRSPRPPVGDAIDALLRQTQRISETLSAAADAAGYVDVRLTGGDDIIASAEVKAEIEAFRTSAVSFKMLPLADWRARVVPGVPDEAMFVSEPAGVDSKLLATFAPVREATPVFFTHRVMLLPTTSSEKGMLRSVQCEATDPVSFALAGGSAFARFPELRGWSAADCARRAVAEHRAWLDILEWTAPPHGWVGPQPSPREPHLRTLGLLFTAARAALFLETLAEGEPQLAVSAAGVAELLVSRERALADVVESAVYALRRARAMQAADLSCISPLLDVVRRLPAYSRSHDWSLAVH
jgi:hypothetical protein